MEFGLTASGPVVERVVLGRPKALRRLERAESIADAQAFIGEADRQWSGQEGEWAIEYQGPCDTAPSHVA